MGIEERFWAKVDKNGPLWNGTPCWVWTASFGSRGYGQFAIWPQRPLGAHRISYEMLIGPIPEDKQIDHLCRNRSCVRPAHLEIVTARENTLRGMSFASANARKLHCPKGHPYDLLNTYFVPSTGRRKCRICLHAQLREYYYRTKERRKG